MRNKEEIFREKALKADREDELKAFRNHFKTDEKLIYFDGNSLGMMPLGAQEVSSTVVSNEWGKRLIRSWNESWWEMPLRVSSQLSELIGCKADEVIVCDSTSVNLFKLASATLSLQKGRKKIVSDNINFPSDLYIIQGIIDSMDDGHYLELAQSRNGIDISKADLYSLIDDDTALVVLSHVSFRSAFMYNMKEVTDYAHKMGSLVIWDLSHAAGAVEVELNDAGADMAVGCTYKYLNGGPGSPAYMYVRQDLQDKIVSPVWGWLGEKNPFEFSLDFRPSQGARRYMTGSPNILSMCPLEPSLDILISAGMKNIRKKSVHLTGYMIELFRAVLEPLGFGLGSPGDPDERGSHVSIKHSEGHRICKALIDEGRGEYTIIPDFRPPDNIRLGLAPLYNRFEEVYIVIYEIERIVRGNVYSGYSRDADSVT